MATQASQLVPGRTINGVLFNGSQNINIPNAVKAWVKFAGSTGAIFGSLNVQSVTRTGNGRYRINIQPGTFSNGNFAAAGMASDVDHFVAMDSYTIGGNSNATQLFITTVDSADNNDAPSDSVEVSVIMVA